MSDNYKKIKKARIISEALQSRGMTQTAISAEIGICQALHKDILELDPVTITIRSGTAEKLDGFIQKHKELLGKDPEPKPSLNTSLPESKPKPTRAMEEVISELEKHGGVLESQPHTKDILQDLTNMIHRFQAKGYHLDVVISRIYVPKQT